MMWAFKNDLILISEGMMIIKYEIMREGKSIKGSMGSFCFSYFLKHCISKGIIFSHTLCHPTSCFLFRKWWLHHRALSWVFILLVPVGEKDFMKLKKKKKEKNYVYELYMSFRCWSSLFFKSRVVFYISAFPLTWNRENDQ